MALDLGHRVQIAVPEKETIGTAFENGTFTPFADEWLNICRMMQGSIGKIVSWSVREDGDTRAAYVLLDWVPASVRVTGNWICENALPTTLWTLTKWLEPCDQALSAKEFVEGLSETDLLRLAQVISERVEEAKRRKDLEDKRDLEDQIRKHQLLLEELGDYVS